MTSDGTPAHTENAASILATEERPSPTGGVILLARLQRPEAMNAISVALQEKLGELAHALRARGDVRALVLIGSGRAFCAGADLKERAGMDEAAVHRFLNRTNEIFAQFEELPIPTIAALNGFAFGGGLELALCCDLRLAAESARLGLTETSLGIIPGAGGTQRLARAIGLPRAKELVFTARKIDAGAALELGLVHESVPDDALLERALEVAEEITQNAPIALKQAKIALNRGYDTDLASGLAIERKAYDNTLPTRDRLEALQAFREKRPPMYRGE